VTDLLIKDTTFKNCSYINSGELGTYLLNVEKIFSVTNGTQSTIQNVTFDNIKTGTITFGGF
jgi:hypothetical protein